MSDIETIARRDRGLRRPACSAWSASTPTRSRRREHILLANLIETAWTQGAASTWPRWSARCSSRRCASSACSSSTSSSRPPTARRSPCGSTACWPRPSFAAWAPGPPLDIGRLLRTADGKPRRGDRDHRPPVRRGAPVRHGARAVEAGHVDAQPERHHRPAGARLHGRGRRLRAADREPADEEADHDADEAGPGLRRRRRAGDAEPGRHRLQGDLQRRHVDGRAAADRAGQGPPARRA